MDPAPDSALALPPGDVCLWPTILGWGGQPFPDQRGDGTLGHT